MVVLINPVLAQQTRDVSFLCHQPMNPSKPHTSVSDRTCRTGGSQTCTRTGKVFFLLYHYLTLSPNLSASVTTVDLLHQDESVREPSTLSDLLGGSTCMDVDVDSVETELNAYTRVKQVPLDTDPLMWWRQDVQEFPLLSRMTRQHLAVPVTSVSPERLFISVGLVKSDFWGRLLDRLTRTYTHLSLCHWHTLVIVSDTHQHIDRDLCNYMTSYPSFTDYQH